MYFYSLWLMPDPRRYHGSNPFAGAAQHRGPVEGRPVGASFGTFGTRMGRTRLLH